MMEWAKQDNYAQTRTMPKFSINTEDPSRWVPTPPDYMDGIEPNWNKMRTFVLDSASLFKPERPTAFSMKKDSQFYKEVMQVYETVNEARELGDESEDDRNCKILGLQSLCINPQRPHDVCH